MTIKNIHSEIKKEYRNGDTWFLQVCNIFNGLMWAIAIWILIATVMMVALMIFLVLVGEIDASVTVGSFFTITEAMAYVIISLSGVVVLFFGLPRRFSNMFNVIANDRVERQRKIYDQADLVEAVLIRHRLITDSQAKQAKMERESANSVEDHK